MAQSATMASSSSANTIRNYPDRFGYPDMSLAPEANGASASKEQPEQQKREEELFPNAKRAWFSYYRAHRNQVVCASVGLAVAAGFLLIGFWPTLLLAVFITAGVLYGRYRDGDRRMTAAVKGIIDRLD